MNSPFCRRCLEFGGLKHTYKIACVQSFKCGTCKHIFPKASFNEKEFLWKSDHETWKAFMTGRLKGKSIEKELTRVKKVANGA